MTNKKFTLFFFSLENMRYFISPLHFLSTFSLQCFTVISFVPQLVNFPLYFSDSILIHIHMLKHNQSAIHKHVIVSKDL